MPFSTNDKDALRCLIMLQAVTAELYTLSEDDEALINKVAGITLT